MSKLNSTQGMGGWLCGVTVWTTEGLTAGGSGHPPPGWPGCLFKDGRRNGALGTLGRG